MKTLLDTQTDEISVLIIDDSPIFRLGMSDGLKVIGKPIFWSEKQIIVLLDMS